MAIFYYTDRPILLVTLLLSYALTVRSQQQILIPSTAEARAINTPVPEKTLDSCGINGNTDTICSPKSGDVWKNGTWYPITWNTMYPTYVSSPTLDIYIYFVQNYQNVLVKKISSISTSKGTVPVFVDDTWRLDPSAKTYESLIYIVPNGVNPEKELGNRYSDYPAPIRNYVEQLASAPTSTTVASSAVSISTTASIQGTSNVLQYTATATTTYIPSLSPTSSENKLINTSIQPWIIAVVVLACVAVLGACLAIFWVMRHSRRRTLVFGEKGHLELNSTTSSSMFPVKQQLSTTTLPVSPIAAVVAPDQATVDNKSYQNQFARSTPSLANNRMYLQNGDRPHSTASFSNISSRSEPPLTSTEALLIADTFRQHMRRPEWQQQHRKKPGNEEDEEMKRRQLSQELLKNELKAEGTLMKKVGKRAHLLAATATTHPEQPSL